MISNHWIAKRKPYWERLASLVRRTDLGLSALTHEELRELGLLYRQTASDLAVVLEDATSPQLASYLNQLLVRNHNLIYSGQRSRGSGIWGFFRDTYPAIFRATFPMTLLATAIFFVAGIAAWAVTASDPTFAHRFLGPQMMQTIERREMWTHSIVEMKPVAASAITTNNISVSIAAFASGITVIGPLWMMALNGILIGVIGAATWKAGMALQLWSFVAAHGALELPAIFIAGGAGLEIARGLLFPGFLRRKTSVLQASQRASKLILGTIPMLLVAGLVEGFFSPSNVPIAMKFGLSAALFTALVAYLSLGFRRKSTADSGLSLPSTD